MAYSVDWPNRVVTIPQSDLSPVSTGGSSLDVYQLDLDAFRLECRRLEASEDGVLYPPIIENTPPAPVDSNTTLARVVRVVNGYRVRFDDSPGAYMVQLAGANNNIADISVLVPNQVSVLASNSAGLVVLSGGVDANITRVAGTPVSSIADFRADVSFLEAIEGGSWKIEDDGTGNAVQVFYNQAGTEVLRVALYRKDGTPLPFASIAVDDITERRRL